MELPNIGCLCAFSECKQLDFLPIQCLYCKLMFCKLHSVNYTHDCTELDPATCSNNIIVENNQPKSFQCTFEECKASVLTQVLCHMCDRQLCLKHRLPNDHYCSHLVIKPIDSRTPKEKVEDLIGRKLENVDSKPKKSVGRKSKTTSSKVVEMKLKMKANGDKSIPLTERLYFNVTVATINEDDVTIPLFFSGEFTIGKIIDVIAKQMKLKNENHITHAPKLCLFTLDTDIVLPVDVKLKDLLLNQVYELQNFGHVLIKYVPSDS